MEAKTMYTEHGASAASGVALAPKAIKKPSQQPAKRLYLDALLHEVTDTRAPTSRDYLGHHMAGARQRAPWQLLDKKRPLEGSEGVCVIEFGLPTSETGAHQSRACGIGNPRGMCLGCLRA